MSSIEQIPIGRFSLMTKLSQKALRLYDQRGLLIPEAKDEITGYRYYTVSQIEKGIKIQMLISMGFNLADITQILNSIEDEDKETIETIFSKRLFETQVEIQRLKKVEEIMLTNKPMELLLLNCTEPTIKTIPSTRVLSKREKGAYSNTIGELIGELMQQIYLPENQRQFVKITGPIMFISYDMEYKETDADIEVAIPISGRITLSSDSFEVKNLPETKVVSVIYTGPYEQIGVGHEKTMLYAIKHKLRLKDNPREIYLTHPDQTSSEQYMTEIQQPIE
jgi:effector-binding domain-containing protein